MTEPSAASRSPQSSSAPTYATAVTVEDFRHNLAAVHARIDAAAERAGRDAAEIRLLPVSKTVPEERLRTAFAAGITQMGENKVQEAQRKSENLADLGIYSSAKAATFLALFVCRWPMTDQEMPRSARFSLLR